MPFEGRFIDESVLANWVVTIQCIHGNEIADKVNVLKFLFLTVKAPITTAADDKFSDIFPNFQKNKV